MTEWIIISIAVLAAAIYLGRLSWRRLRTWLGKQPAGCHSMKGQTSKPQKLTLNGKKI